MNECYYGANVNEIIKNCENLDESKRFKMEANNVCNLLLFRFLPGGRVVTPDFHLVRPGFHGLDSASQFSPSGAVTKI